MIPPSGSSVRVLGLAYLHSRDTLILGESFLAE